MLEQRIAAAINAVYSKPPCKTDTVVDYYPLLLAGLDRYEINTRNMRIVSCATIGVESPTFKPVKEYGGEDYYNRMYDTGHRAKNLGNTPEADGDGALWCGRGWIQLTGHDNYLLCSRETGIPLMEDPELALVPEHAATIFAWYLKRKRVFQAAEAWDLATSRKRVNGGLNGWKLYEPIANNLALITEI